jgi:hypothetical protein
MTDVKFVVPVLGSWNHVKQTASIRYVRSWRNGRLRRGLPHPASHAVAVEARFGSRVRKSEVRALRGRLG